MQWHSKVYWQTVSLRLKNAPGRVFWAVGEQQCSTELAALALVTAGMRPVWLLHSCFLRNRVLTRSCRDPGSPRAAPLSLRTRSTNGDS